MSNCGLLSQNVKLVAEENIILVYTETGVVAALLKDNCICIIILLALHGDNIENDSLRH